MGSPFDQFVKMNEIISRSFVWLRRTIYFGCLRRGASNALRRGQCQVKIYRKVPRIDLQLEEYDSSDNLVRRVLVWSSSEVNVL